MSQIKGGILLSYISMLFLNLAGLFTTPIIVKTLGVDNYGVYVLILSLVGYIALVDLGITTTINRFIARYRAINNKAKEQEFISVSLRLMFIILILVILLGCILSKNIEYIINIEYINLITLKKIVGILILTLLFKIFVGFINGYLAAYEKFIFIKSIDIIKTILRVFLLVCIFSGKGNVLDLVLLDMLLALFILISSIVYFFKIKENKLEIDLYNSKLLKEIVGYSIWVFIFSMIAQIQWQSGQIIIGYKINPAAVGVYSIGIILGTYYGAFSSAITGIFVSRTTFKVYQSPSKLDLLNYTIDIGRISAIILMLVLINFLIIGKDFISLWVGDDFKGAWLIAVVIMVSYTTPLIQAIANQVLEAKKMFSFKSKIYLIFLSFGVLLGYILIDYYYIYGMIIGISIGWNLAVIIMSLYYHYVLDINMVKFFSRLVEIFLIAVIAVIFGLALNYFFSEKTWLIISLKSIIVSLFYLTLIYRYSMNKKELTIFNNIWRSRFV